MIAHLRKPVVVGSHRTALLGGISAGAVGDWTNAFPGKFSGKPDNGQKRRDNRFPAHCPTLYGRRIFSAPAVIRFL